MADWNTAEPPWLARMRPDLVEAHPVDRADDLVAQLDQAAGCGVPVALAGHGWRQVGVAEYHDEPTEPVMRARTRGPWPCQQSHPLPCPDCDRTFDTPLQLAVHRADHNRRPPEPAQHRPPGKRTAAKPKPGARTKKRRSKGRK